MQRDSLQDKRVVVLGGSSGIGLEVAKQAASQGASVVIASSSAERVQKAIESIGGEAQGQAVDVSDERAVATFFSKLGAFDHLVFTAGDSLHLHDLAATDLPQARHAFELRYWAPRISHRPDTPLSCVIGPHSPRSNTEAPIFAKEALSCSQPESLASARKRDG